MTTVRVSMVALLALATYACAPAVAPGSASGPGETGAHDLDAPPPPRRQRVALPESSASPPREQLWRPPAYHAPPRMSLSPRGKRIDINIKNADLHNVFRFLADVGGVNIVVAPDVQGAVTLRLKSVPWDSALLAICKAHRLDVERDGSIVLITGRR